MALKKMLAVFLLLGMLLSMFPFAAWAQEEEGQEGEESEVADVVSDDEDEELPADQEKEELSLILEADQNQQEQQKQEQIEEQNQEQAEEQKQEQGQEQQGEQKKETDPADGNDGNKNENIIVDPQGVTDELQKDPDTPEVNSGSQQGNDLPSGGDDDEDDDDVPPLIAATVNGDEYETLQEAIDAVEGSGATITLGDYVDETVTIPYGYSVVIDLNDTLFTGGILCYGDLKIVGSGTFNGALRIRGYQEKDENGETIDFACGSAVIDANAEETTILGSVLAEQKTDARIDGSERPSLSISGGNYYGSTVSAGYYSGDDDFSADDGAGSIAITGGLFGRISEHYIAAGYVAVSYDGGATCFVRLRQPEDDPNTSLINAGGTQTFSQEGQQKASDPPVMLGESLALGTPAYTGTPMCTVTYVLFDGTGYETEMVEQGTEITLTARSRNGYTFSGWSSGEDFYSTGDTVPIEADTTFTANWEAVTFSIEFEPNGGTCEETTATYTMEEAVTFPTPEKEGADFGGWYESPDFSGDALTGIAKGTIGPSKVYAKWLITLTLDPESSSSSVGQVCYQGKPLGRGQSVQIAQNEDLELTFVIVQKGVHLSEFLVDGTAVSPVPEDQVVIPNVDRSVTVKATFDNSPIADPPVEEKKETPMLGSASGGMPEFQPDSTTDKKTTLMSASETPSTVTVTENLMLEASKEPEHSTSSVMALAGETEKYSVTVYYNALGFVTHDGDAAIASGSSYEIESGSSTTLKFTPKNETDYKIDDCTLNGESRGAVSTLTIDNVQANQIVTVSFIPNAGAYNITYHFLRNGTDISAGVDNSRNPQKYSSEDEDIILQDAAKNGYEFKGWFTNADYSNQVTKISNGSTGDREFWGRFDPIEYKITYALNGGELPEGKTIPATYTIEDEIVFPDASKTGYSFDGWYTTTDPKTKMDKIEKGSTGDVSIEAKYTIINYPVKYNLDGGTNSPENPAQYTIEEEVLLKDPTKEGGYRFAGWYSDAAMENQTSGIAKGSTGEKEFWAKFLKVYSITYELDGGTNDPSNPDTYTEESGIILLEDPVKSGYVFAGWYDSPEFENRILAIDCSTEKRDITLYARFLKYYTITYHLNGGMNNPYNPAGFKEGENVIVLANPIRSGYSFKGWFDSETFTNQIKQIDPKDPKDQKNTVLYAKWEINPAPVRSYEVYVYYNSFGSVSYNGVRIPNSTSVEVEEGQTITLYFNPSDSKYYVYNCTLNGEKKGSISSLTIENISSNQRVVVSFMPTIARPMTGDSSNLLLWTGLMAASACAVSMLLVRKRRLRTSDGKKNKK